MYPQDRFPAITSSPNGSDTLCLVSGTTSLMVADPQNHNCAMDHWEDALQSLYVDEAEARSRFHLAKDIQASKYSVRNPKFDTGDSKEEFYPPGVSPVFLLRNWERDGPLTPRTKTLLLARTAPMFSVVQKPNKYSQVRVTSVKNLEVKHELVEFDLWSPESASQLNKRIKMCQQAKCQAKTLCHEGHPPSNPQAS